MEQQVMEVQNRESRGKGGARTTRREGRVPAVVYGGKAESIAISVEPRAMEKILTSEHGHNVVLTLEIPGQGKTPAIIRDWQVDPVLGKLLHVDFLRIAMDEVIRVKVAVHFEGNPVGVKDEGGQMEIVHREVEIEALPGDIPEDFRVDVTPIELNQAFRVSDLPVDSDKIRVLTEGKEMLFHVVPPRVVEEETPAEGEEVVVDGDAASAEPEVVKRGKAAEEGAEGDEKSDKKD